VKRPRASCFGATIGLCSAKTQSFSKVIDPGSTFVVRCWSRMSCILIWLEAFRHCGRTAHRVLVDLVGLLLLATRSRGALAAENLFLRKQLALFQERNARPHQAEDSARWLWPV